MSQQMKNGSHREGDVTITVRDTARYAVVNPPLSGLHRKPQDDFSIRMRKLRWRIRNLER